VNHELRLAHDDLTYRKREQGEVIAIPHAERYATTDWLVSNPPEGMLVVSGAVCFLVVKDERGEE